jgi:carbon storage regulator
VLVLSRKLHERVRLRLPDGRDVWLVVIDIDKGKVRLGIQAPKDIGVLREELLSPAPLMPAVGVSPAAARLAAGKSCCERHANVLACDCRRVAAQGCRFCGGTGAEPLPGGVAFVACRDGCRTRCSICNDPKCAEPGGKH